MLGLVFLSWQLAEQICSRFGFIRLFRVLRPPAVEKEIKASVILYILKSTGFCLCLA